MKKLLVNLIVLLICFPINAQSYRNLKVFKTSEFNTKSSITVDGNSYDPLNAADALRNALVVNGFKVISERMARDKVEIINRGSYSDSTFNQNVSIGSTKTVNSIYYLTIASIS